MKFTTLLIIALCLHGAAAKTYAQQVNIKANNSPLETVFKDIEKQTDYKFVYTRELLDKANTVTTEISNVSLQDALQVVFSQQSLDYTLYTKMIVVKEKVLSVAANNAEFYRVMGSVTDEKGKPIAGATVFLTNTAIATATNDAGKFILDRVSAGNYELIVNMIGFESGRQSIKVQNNTIEVNMVLKESNTLLNAVVIKGKPDRKRDEYLKLFIYNFIGNKGNATQCKLLNPEVLNYSINKKRNTLDVSASDFIIIENNALGYRIKYLLKKFYSYFNIPNVCYYYGDSYFEEMKGTDEQQKQWEANRRVAYLGSYRHFFRTITRNRSRAEGFYVYETYAKKGMAERTRKQLMDIDTTLIKQDDNFKILLKKVKFEKKDTLYHTLYVSYMPVETNQVTRVYQYADTVTIDKNGNMNPAMGFSFYGRWGGQRVADLTPLGYFVDPLEDRRKTDVATKNTQ